MSLEMRHILEERIRVDLKHGPDVILDKIEKFIHRKRSVLLNMVDFETRQHKLEGNLDLYLVAIQHAARGRCRPHTRPL